MVSLGLGQHIRTFALLLLLLLLLLCLTLKRSCFLGRCSHKLTIDDALKTTWPLNLGSLSGLWSHKPPKTGDDWAEER